MNYVVRAIYVSCAHDFNSVIAVGWKFCYDGGYILVKVRSQYGLYYKYMIVAFHCGNNSQIIHVAVPVEVQIGYDV